jgi:hypothetical protein
MPEMTIREVIANLKNFDCWEFKNYDLRKEEADAIIKAFDEDGKE